MKNDNEKMPPCIKPATYPTPELMWPMGFLRRRYTDIIRGLWVVAHSDQLSAVKSRLVLNRVAGHTTCGTLLSAFEHHDRPFETF